MRPLHRFVGLATILIAAGGCGDAVGPVMTMTHFRLVNAVVNLQPGHDGSINVLIDSLTAPPGVLNLAPGGVRDYVETPVGVRSYEARFSAPDRGEPLFLNANGQPYLVRQYFTAGFRYTLIPTGVFPAVGNLGAGDITPTIILDDPYPGPVVNGRYQARVRLINVAPFAGGTAGTGTALRLYVTPGDTPLSTVAGLRWQVTASYRAASGEHVNLEAGDYVITVTVGTSILASMPVKLASGEVRDFVLVSTEAVVAPATAGPQNHKLLNLFVAQH
jgi:hypothetical protein